MNQSVVILYGGGGRRVIVVQLRQQSSVQPGRHSTISCEGVRKHERISLISVHGIKCSSSRNIKESIFNVPSAVSVRE